MFLTVMFFLVANVASAFSIRYYNKDSKDHKMEVRTNGSTKSIEFRSSTTGSSSVQTSADTIEVKTSCGWVTVEDGDKITIKDGCITID